MMVSECANCGPVAAGAAATISWGLLAGSVASLPFGPIEGLVGALVELLGIGNCG
jgi:hypothetical protein